MMLMTSIKLFQNIRSFSMIAFPSISPLWIGPSLFEVISANLNKDFQERFHETLCKWADKYGKIYTIGFLQRRFGFKITRL